MVRSEPQIKVGICTGQEVRFRLNGLFRLEDSLFSGTFRARAEAAGVRVFDEKGREILHRAEVLFRPEGKATFTIYDVTIGVNFHWERKQEEIFYGDLRFIASDAGGITAVNEIPLEDYLVSVISSEMSDTAPLEFLKAHAVISRSWLMAMLEQKGNQALPVKPSRIEDGEIIRWYDRKEHELFDVCADDHCQRYQGIGLSQGERAGEAVRATRGLFLIRDNEICDARYHKACGGMTEDFATAWEDKEVPCLSSVADSAIKHPPVRTEREARNWILSHPDAYCNVADIQVLQHVLPVFDRETENFFRWQVEYSRTELEEIIGEKTEIDVGILHDLVPLMRGASGRIFRLQIIGSKGSVIVGKELEIRRLLSRSHLLSSAFIVSIERDPFNVPARFILQGAGWGHGVGLCQIGAAVMADRGFKAMEILLHYFSGAHLKQLY